jgi:TonB family protein
MGAPIQAKGRIRSKNQPIKISGDALQSKLVRKVDPIYPEQAESAQLSGKVVLLVTVDEDGVPSDVEVVNGRPILADSAVWAAIQWRYIPTIGGLNGREPVPVMATVTVIFSLTGSGGTVQYMGGQIESGKNGSERK